MKVAVYAIAKNEEMHVNRFMDSVVDFDGVFILDTGSDDDTVELLRERGATVVESTISPFRFDVARNASMHSVPEGYDYLLCLDLDEVIEEGAYDKIVSHIKQTRKHSYILNSIYDADLEGNINVPKKCLHTREGHFWKYHVHEILETKPEFEISKGNVDVTINHYPDREKSRSQYLSLLEDCVTVYKDDPRPLMYLGREHFYMRNTFDAIMWLKLHIEKETYGPFRARSAIMISEAYENFDIEDNISEAEAWLLRACSEFNSSREAYYKLGDLYFSCGAFASAIGMFESCLRIREVPDVSDIVDMKYFDDKVIYHYMASSYFNMGMKEVAKNYAQKAISLYHEVNVELPKELMLDLTRIFSDIIEEGGQNAQSKGEDQEIEKEI